jgi:hypothetical protein
VDLLDDMGDPLLLVGVKGTEVLSCPETELNPGTGIALSWPSAVVEGPVGGIFGVRGVAPERDRTPSEISRSQAIDGRQAQITDNCLAGIRATHHSDGATTGVGR